MSAFHRIDPESVEFLTADDFWPRVRRLMHYGGAVRSVAIAEAQASPARPDENYTAPSAGTGELNDPTPEQIRALRDAARRRKYPAAQFGEMRYVSDTEIVRKAGTNA